MKILLIKIGLGITLFLGLYSWYSYNQTIIKNLQEDLILYKSSYEEAERTITDMSNFNIKQSKELELLYSRNARAEIQVRELEVLLSRHDLRDLAQSKPKMIEKRINEGTAKVLKELEDLTRE